MYFPPDTVWFENTAPAVFAILADTTIKGFLLLALAGLAALGLRKATAAARHLIWMLSIIGLMILPVLYPVAPRWSLDVLPSPSIRVEQAKAPAAHPAKDLPRPKIEQPAPPTLAVPSVKSVSGQPLQTAPVQTPRRPAPAFEASESPAPLRSPPKSRVSFPPLYWILPIWLAGFLIALAPLLLGVAIVWVVARRARPLKDDDWRTAVEDVRRTLHLERPVRVFQANGNFMPMTFGYWRPAVLVPREAGAWSEAKRRAVLLHELAHVRRRDYLTQTIAHLSCALHWFNPLAWVALRRLRVERERACDDLVLASGLAASDYAGHLLEIAHAFRAPAVASACAVTMARPSSLEGRIRTLLDATRKRGGVTLRILGILCVAAFLALAVFALVDFSGTKLKRVPLGEELSTRPDVSLVRQRKSSGSSMSSGGKKIEAENYTLLDILRTVDNSQNPIILLADLPRGRYNVFAEAPVGDRRTLLKNLCEVYSEAFGLSVTRRKIETDVLLLTCPTTASLTIEKAAEDAQSKGFYKHLNLAENRMKTSFRVSIDELALVAGYFIRNGASNEFPVDKNLFGMAFVNETGLDGIYEGGLIWKPGEPSVTEASLTEMGFKLVPARREIEAIVVEHATPGQARTYLLDTTNGPIPTEPLKRTLHMRLYPNPGEEPETFERITETVNVLREIYAADEDGKPLIRSKGIIEPLKISKVGLPSNAALVVAPSDQTDSAIQEILRAEIRVWRTSRFPDRIVRRIKQNTLKIKDATGKPIAGADVTLILVDSSKGATIRMTGYKSDDDGQIGVTPPNNSSPYLLRALEVSHEDYGRTEVKCLMSAPPQGIFLPLVRSGSSEFERILRGIVRDPHGRPVKGVRIRCDGVLLSGGSRISVHGDSVTFSDSSGRFTFYPPDDKRSTSWKGRLIPLNGLYNIRAEAPESLELFPYVGRHDNTRETEITMERGDRFHTFAFEDEDGPIEDEKRLRYIRVTLVRPAKTPWLGSNTERTTLQLDFWRSGALLPYGKYEAELHIDDIHFEPIQISKDSPERIVFRVPERKLFRGRVVHGVTGEPMPGAFVVGRWSADNDHFSGLSDREWDILHAWP